MSDLIPVLEWLLVFFVAAATAWFAWKALFPPDRRLELATSEGLDGPQQTKVTISSKGKYGVSPEQFGNQPLTLTLDPPAKSVFSTELSTGRTPMLCEARDGKLVVNPGPIAADEILTILVETQNPGTATITHHDHQMAEVKFTKVRGGRKVKGQAKEKSRRPRALGVQLVFSVALAGVSLLAAILTVVSFLSPPPLTVTPKPIAPGETVTVCGSNLHSFDVIELELGYETGIDQDDRDVASGQVDANGHFCLPFRLPEATKLGNSKLTVSVVNGGHTTFYDVEMSVASK